VSARDNAPVRGRGQIEIDASQQVVWEVLTRLEDWPSWNGDV